MLICILSVLFFFFKEANLELQKRVPPSVAQSSASVDPDADSSMLNSSEIIPASAQKSNR